MISGYNIKVWTSISKLIEHLKFNIQNHEGNKPSNIYHKTIIMLNGYYFILAVMPSVIVVKFIICYAIYLYCPFNF